MKSPPLPEQLRIAALLDKADALQQSDRQLLTKYDALTKSLFLNLFGKEKSASQDWPVVKFETIASHEKGSMRTGPFGSDLLHSEFVDEGIFVLGIDNVVNNRFEWAKSRFISEEKYEILKRYTVKPGDVLISIMGTIGRIAVVPDSISRAINSKHLAAITLNQKISCPAFAAALLQFDLNIQQQIKSQGRGAIMDGLNLASLKIWYLISLPSLYSKNSSTSSPKLSNKRLWRRSRRRRARHYFKVCCNGVLAGSRRRLGISSLR